MYAYHSGNPTKPHQPSECREDQEDSHGFKMEAMIYSGLHSHGAEHLWVCFAISRTAIEIPVFFTPVRTQLNGDPVLCSTNGGGLLGGVGSKYKTRREADKDKQ